MDDLYSHQLHSKHLKCRRDNFVAKGWSNHKLRIFMIFLTLVSGSGRVHQGKVAGLSKPNGHSASLLLSIKIELLVQ